MLNTLKQLFGFGSKIDYKELKNRNALIIDVRTKGEYNEGHIKGSLNIPLDQINTNLSKIEDKNRPIITCCASGMRSSLAKGILKSAGYQEVYNGGGWMSLNKKMN